MKKYIILIPILFMCYFLFSQTVIDYQDISGIWTKENSPYLIYSDLVLNQNDTLIIEAGVNVIFQDYYGLEVRGHIEANGLPNDSICFTVADTSGYYNNTHIGWNGIWNSDYILSGNLDYTILEYGKSAGGAVLLSEGSDYFNIFHSTIRFNNGGVMLSFGDYHFNHIKVMSNGFGINFLHGQGTVIISDFIIANNGATGIHIGTGMGQGARISDGIIQNNGGGIYFGDDAGGPILIENCIIQGNYNNGGIRSFESFVLKNCEIKDNISSYNGGGLAFGLYPTQTYTIDNCIISGNIANNDGGGIYHPDGGSINIQNTIIENNQAKNGAGIYTKLTGWSSAGEINNVILRSNQAIQNGGGIYITDILYVPDNLSNITIYSNIAGMKGGGIYCDPLHFYQTVTISNSIIWGNTNDQVWDTTGNLILTYSDIENGYTGSGNIDQDPQFISVGLYPLDLEEQSPCINAGDPIYIPTENKDIAGRARIFNDTIDIGAYEADGSFGPSYELKSKVLFAGGYNGGFNSSILQDSNLIPNDQPFYSWPWFYLGNENITEIPETDISDWILLEFRKASNINAANDSSIILRSACFVRSDGTVVDTSGFRKPVFKNLQFDSLYLVINHRNHKRIMSSHSLVPENFVYDFCFTTKPSMVYGGEKSLFPLGNNSWGMIPGNGFNDDQINNLDKNESWIIQQGQTGYMRSDFNFDGLVDELDLDVWRSSCGMGYPLPSFQEPSPWQCGDTLIDNRDAKKYKTVLIGEQCWMVQSLNYGSMIDTLNDQTDNGIIEKYCYQNLESNCESYGAIYQWSEIMNYSILEGAQGICPEGWHIPADYEWCYLENLVDSDTIDCNSTGYRGIDAGGNLKAISSLWVSPNTGATNLSGFSGIPGGYYDYLLNQIVGVGLYSQFFTSSATSTDDCWTRSLQYNTQTIRRKSQSGEFGQSLRCLRDIEY